MELGPELAPGNILTGYSIIYHGWWLNRQNVSSNPSHAGCGTCVIEQDT